MTTPDPTPPQTPQPPARLQLPTRLSEQVPGLASYGLNGASAPAAGLNGAIRTSDRDEKETRKVRTILASVGLFVAMILAVVILAGSRSQPTAEERLAWNKAEISLLQHLLVKVPLKRYRATLADAAVSNDSARAVRAMMVADLRRELERLDQILNSSAGLSDGELWNRTRHERLIAERALAWTDGYDRPFEVAVGGLRLTIQSLGANGRVDTEADLPKDDLTASVTMSSGEPMQVKMWDEVFKLPDMSQVQIFDPGNPESMEKVREMDPQHLTPRERMMEMKGKMFDLMDEGYYGADLDRKLREYELKEGIPQPGDTQKRPKLTDEQLKSKVPHSPYEVPVPGK